MDVASNNPAPQRLPAYSWIITVLFCGALFLPAVVWLMGFQWNEMASEKRVAAATPTIPKNWVEANAFPNQMNAWFNDRFPFRRPLVEINASWTVNLVESPHFNVIIGRDKWLFLRDGTEALYRSVVVPPESIKAFDLMLRERAAWLKARGMSYLFVIVPDKHCVYPEKLPFILSVQEGARASYLQQMLAGLSPEARALCLDLTPVFRNAKSPQYDLFKHSDTHWNFRGAMAGQQGIVERLRPQFPNLRAVTGDDYVFHSISYSGDLSMLIAQTERFKEDFEMGDPRVKKSIYEDPNQPWQPQMTIRSNQQGSKLPKLMIFGDSFLEWLHPVLSEAFGGVSAEINTGDKTPKTEFVPAKIEQYKPDIVINESIERFLYVQVMENPPEVKAALKK